MSKHALIIAALGLALGACGDGKKAPSVRTNPEPWEVVCDNAGHYTFIFETGTLWDLQEWDNYDAALAYSLRIKRQREWDRTHPVGLAADDSGFEATRNRINARNYQKCPPPEARPSPIP
jgi:hypothetical protein